MMNHSLTDILNIKYPIIQAPMAGGITTTELVASVSNFGGLGSVGAGYMTPDKLREQIINIKSKTTENFNVNLFVSNKFEVAEKEVENANKLLQTIKYELGLEEEKVNIPTYEDTLSTFHEQIEVILEESVPICSFTFGLPDKEVVANLKNKGIVVMATATTVEEAIE